MPDINAIADVFRAAIASYEQAQADVLTLRYQSVLDALKPKAERLVADIEAAWAKGEAVSRSWLLRQERYQALIAQTEAEINRFAGTAEQIITAAQSAAVGAAEQNTQALIKAANVSRTFNRLPTSAFENLVGTLGDGSPLKTLLGELGKDGSRAVGDALAKGVALGLNPRQTAKAISEAAGVPLSRALAISRTETLRAYRQAAIQSYQENDDVVSGWRWLAALSSRSCAMCIAMHGTVHLNTEAFGSHVNCRCTPAPLVEGSEGAGFETGAEWFAKQSANAQDTILGSRVAGEAYRARQVALRDFIGEKQDDKWGLTKYAVSLRGAFKNSNDEVRQTFSDLFGKNLDDPNGIPNLDTLQKDMKKIVQIVTTKTGLNSRWKGEVIVTDERNADGSIGFVGRKEWGCPISLHSVIVGHIERYTTSLHEAIHSVSVGLEEDTFRTCRGFEEGVVTVCTFILTSDIAVGFGISLPAPLNPYRSMTKTLERLRAETDLNEVDFYFGLLRINLDQREQGIIKWIAQKRGVRLADVKKDIDITADLGILRNQ